jgi:hypothetical protein
MTRVSEEPMADVRTAAQRSRQARDAALTRWSKEDPIAGTQAARDALMRKFDDQVDPDRVLPPAERERRAARARRVYFAQLARRPRPKARRVQPPDAQ